MKRTNVLNDGPSRFPDVFYVLSWMADGSAPPTYRVFMESDWKAAIEHAVMLAQMGRQVVTRDINTPFPDEEYARLSGCVTRDIVTN